MVFGKDKLVGTLVPVFSLHSTSQLPADQGTFATALLFLDWLKKTNQNAWQMLPLSETQLEKGSRKKHVPSPYKGYGIGIDPQYLSTSYALRTPTSAELNEFLKKHSFWVEDYALFCALREQFGTDDWRQWDDEVRQYNENTIVPWKKKLKNSIEYFLVQQWQLHTAFDEVHTKARRLGISLIGDIPFYLSCNSPLVWKFQHLFQIEENGEMNFVSGAVSKIATHFGRQVWGHPLYQWEKVDEVAAFWKLRLKYRSYLYDVIRFDYAIGFFEYAAKDPLHPENDTVFPGPGANFFQELINFARENNLEVFAEDSGKQVVELRKYLQKAVIPGIRIFRFAFNELLGGVNEYYAITQNYPENAVVYTTTHDTETLMSYLSLLKDDQRQILATTINSKFSPDIHAFAKEVRDKIINSPAKTVIIPIQDWLLTNERINIPGTEKEVDDTNWKYKVSHAIENLPIQL